MSTAITQEALAAPDTQMPGIARAVLPMHIYNLCLRRSKLPALVLDIRSSQDFDMMHIVDSFSCPVESPNVNFEDLERTLAAAPVVLQRVQNRQNVAVAVVSHIFPHLQHNISFILCIRSATMFQLSRL
jgi:hypothetical protein